MHAGQAQMQVGGRVSLLASVLSTNVFDDFFATLSHSESAAVFGPSAAQARSVSRTVADNVDPPSVGPPHTLRVDAPELRIGSPKPDPPLRPAVIVPCATSLCPAYSRRYLRSQVPPPHRLSR
jgi:hypothetical protein